MTKFNGNTLLCEVKHNGIHDVYVDFLCFSNMSNKECCGSSTHTSSACRKLLTGSRPDLFALSFFLKQLPPCISCSHLSFEGHCSAGPRVAPRDPQIACVAKLQTRQNTIFAVYRHTGTSKTSGGDVCELTWSPGFPEPLGCSSSPHMPHCLLSEALP